jgi:glycine cleavage system H lipoate-binding protein
MLQLAALQAAVKREESFGTSESLCRIKSVEKDVARYECSFLGAVVVVNKDCVSTPATVSLSVKSA